MARGGAAKQSVGSVRGGNPYLSSWVHNYLYTTPTLCTYTANLLSNSTPTLPILTFNKNTFLCSNGSYRPIVSIRLSSRQSLLETSGSGTIGGVMRESSRLRIAVLPTRGEEGQGRGEGEGEGGFHCAQEWSSWGRCMVSWSLRPVANPSR